MEDLGLEVHFRWHDGVLGGEGDLDQEDILGIGSVSRSLDESLPSEQIILVVHEQKLVKCPLGCLDGFLHQSLLIHPKILLNNLNEISGFSGGSKYFEVEVVVGSQRS